MVITLTDTVVTVFMLGAAAILFIGFLGRALAKKTLIPYIVWLMLFGVLIGPIFGVINFSTSSMLLPSVSTIVLVLFLFNGGLNLNIKKIFNNKAPLLTLSFANFCAATALIGLVMYVLGYSVVQSVLIGLLMGSISSAIIPSLKEGANKKDGNILASLESIITEPFGIIMVLIALAAILISNYSISTITTSLFSEFSIGVVIGAIFGMGWIPAMSYFQRFRYEYSYAASLAIVFALYTIVQYVGGSGPIAALVFGFIIANGDGMYHALKYRHGSSFSLSRESKSFNDLITFLMTSFFFVYFGSLITTNDYYGFIVGAMIALATMVARQISTNAALYKQNVSSEEKYHTSFMLSRGTGTAIIAALLFSYNLFGRLNLLDVTFGAILFTVFLNGMLLLVFREVSVSGGKEAKKQ